MFFTIKRYCLVASILFSYIGNAQDFKTLFEKTSIKHEEQTLTMKELDSVISVCPDLSKYPDLLFYKGSLHYDTENYPLMLNTLLEAQKYAKDFQLKYDILNNIGSVYNLTEKFDLAEDYFKQAMQLAEDANRSDERDYAFENILLVKIDSGDIEVLEEYEAFFYEKDYSEQPCLQIETFSLIVENHLFLENFDKAKQLLNNFEPNIAALVDCKYQLLVYYNNYAAVAIQDMDYEKSLMYLNLIELDAVPSLSDKIDTYELYKQVYISLRQEDIATLYNDSIVAILNDNIQDLNNANIEMITQIKDEQDRSAVTIVTLRNGLIASGLALAIIMPIFFISRRKMKHIETQKESYKQKYSGLTVDYKLSTNQLSNLKDVLKEQHLKNPSKEVKQLINNLSLFLNDQNVEAKSQKVMDNDVMAKIENNLPYLNASERMVCYFLHLNLTHKKIGELLNKTEKSIDSYKYRINKKMMEKENRSIQDYLNNLKIN